MGLVFGRPHIHAAGCAHYDVPTQGVAPETVIPHVRGEGLSIAGVLNWGPGYEYQKQFFTGHAVSPRASMEHPDRAQHRASMLYRRDYRNLWPCPDITWRHVALPVTTLLHIKGSR